MRCSRLSQSEVPGEPDCGQCVRSEFRGQPVLSAWATGAQGTSWVVASQDTGTPQHPAVAHVLPLAFDLVLNQLTYAIIFCDYSFSLFLSCY